MQTPAQLNVFTKKFQFFVYRIWAYRSDDASFFGMHCDKPKGTQLYSMYVQLRGLFNLQCSF